MSIRLWQAVNAVNDRKVAVFGNPAEDSIELRIETAAEDRLMVSGFDIDHDELRSIAEAVGQMFTGLAIPLGPLGLPSLFASAWVEGLLVGLFASKQLAPPTNPSGDGVDATSPDGGGN